MLSASSGHSVSFYTTVGVWLARLKIRRIAFQHFFTGFHWTCTLSLIADDLTNRWHRINILMVFNRPEFGAHHCFGAMHIGGFYGHLDNQLGLVLQSIKVLK